MHFCGHTQKNPIFDKKQLTTSLSRVLGYLEVHIIWKTNN